MLWIGTWFGRSNVYYSKRDFESDACSQVFVCTIYRFHVPEVPFALALLLHPSLWLQVTIQINC